MDQIVIKILQLFRLYRFYWWLRVSFIPTLLDYYLGWSVRMSKDKCSLSQPLLVLVDLNVIKHATTHKSYPFITDTRSGFELVPVTDPTEIELLDSAVKSQKKELAMYESVKYLNGIAFLAKTGAIEICTSALLEAEKNSSTNKISKDSNYDDHNLFGLIDIKSLDGFSLSVGDTSFPYKKTKLNEFIDSQNCPRFLEIKNCLKAKQNRDAYHIYVAEKFGAICFLTMDYELLETLGKRQIDVANLNLRTNVWTPEQLGKYLRILQIPPTYMSYKHTDGPIRNKAHTPTQRRVSIHDWPS